MTSHSLIEEFRKRGYDVAEGSVAEQAITAYYEGAWLVLHGTPGTGKTFFFHILQKIGCAIKIISAQEVATWKKDEVETFLDEAKNAEVVIDDFGQEGRATNYGTAYEPILRIMEARIAQMKRVHLSTNYTGSKLKEIYPPAYFDRLRYFTPFAFQGTSRRKPLMTPSPWVAEERRKEAERKREEQQQKEARAQARKTSVALLTRYYHEIEKMPEAEAEKAAVAKYDSGAYDYKEAQRICRALYADNLTLPPSGIQSIGNVISGMKL